MIVFKFEKGFLASQPLSDRPISGKRGVLASVRGTSILDSASISTMPPHRLTLLMREREEFPPPAPYVVITVSNGRHEIQLTSEEVQEIYDFTLRKEEARLREEFNAARKAKSE